MTADHAIALARTYGADNYAPLPVVLARGEGAFVFDTAGRRYFDFLSAYSAVSQGHCHPRIVKALVEQASTLSLTSRAFHNDRMGAMLERIARVSGYEKVLPMNTGAEAVETALKAMRRWGYEQKGVPDGTAEILVAEGNFHGRTTTIVGFSDEPDYTRHFGPPTPGFRLVPFGDAAALAAAIGPHTVGVLLEPIQGEGGVRIPPDGYLTEVRAACTRANVLLCFDEIQTGLGRTGRMFAFEHEGARPDLLVLGKALSGGLYPVSCLCADDRVMRVFTPGSHGSTYGGNPLAAAVTLAALDVLEDEKLAERSAELGGRALERLRGALRGHPAVREVRGRGLMIAVEYHEKIARAVAHELCDVSVLAKDTRGDVIRLMPPLVIREDDLNAALDLAIPVLARESRASASGPDDLQ
ncbi:MAG: ornithine--oxo-acid transaminase [Myxococcales bacterium]|nr:ornithine--oxo-acid transaminase [Myxococcales bacterium]